MFISDVHLGSRGCQAEYLRQFPSQLDTEQRVLVGDIVDLWSLKRSMYWPSAHQEVLRTILRLAREGTGVIYVPGNHDEALCELCGHQIAGIEIRRDFLHETADGKRYLVLHRDDFVAAVTVSGWLKHVGGRMYDVLLWLGRLVQSARRRCGFGYWSLATWITEQVPAARRCIERFEHAAAHAALRHGLDGVICGHIHRPGIRDVDGVRYCNDGDWVEHCTALVEDRSGRLGLVYFASEARLIGFAGQPVVPLPAAVMGTAA